MGAEETVVITVGRVVWFECGWEGVKEVASEVGGREIGRIVTGRERVVNDRIDMVL